MLKREVKDRRGQNTETLFTTTNETSQTEIYPKIKIVQNKVLRKTEFVTNVLKTQQLTGASAIAIGCRLFQWNSEGVKTPIAFTSLKFSPSQTRRSTIEKEAIGNCFVYGSRSLTCPTDHSLRMPNYLDVHCSLCRNII